MCFHVRFSRVIYIKYLFINLSKLTVVIREVSHRWLFENQEKLMINYTNTLIRNLQLLAAGLNV